MKGSRLLFAFAPALVVLTACGGGQGAGVVATATVPPPPTVVPSTPTPTPIPHVFNPDYPIYTMPPDQVALLGQDRVNQISQVHALLSPELQRRLDAWGANFRVARSMDELMAMPEYKDVQRPEEVFAGYTTDGLRTYGAIVDQFEGLPWYDLIEFYSHELGHVLHGMLNEAGIKLNAEYYLRTMLGSEVICPTKEKDMEAWVARCRDYLLRAGVIDNNGQYTGQMILDLTPLMTTGRVQVVPMPTIQSKGTSAISYPPSPIAIQNPVEWFAEAVSTVLGGLLGQDYALIGGWAGYSPFYTLRDTHPEFFAFIEGLLTNPDMAKQFLLSEQELLEIRYGPR